MIENYIDESALPHRNGGVCRTCVHWCFHMPDIGEHLDMDGKCKRFPPVLVPVLLKFACCDEDPTDDDVVIGAVNSPFMYKQPTTNWDDSCGEWKGIE